MPDKISNSLTSFNGSNTNSIYNNYSYLNDAGEEQTPYQKYSYLYDKNTFQNNNNTPLLMSSDPASVNLMQNLTTTTNNETSDAKITPFQRFKNGVAGVNKFMNKNKNVIAGAASLATSVVGSPDISNSLVDTASTAMMASGNPYLMAAGTAVKLTNSLGATKLASDTNTWYSNSVASAYDHSNDNLFGKKVGFFTNKRKYVAKANKAAFMGIATDAIGKEANDRLVASQTKSAFPDYNKMGYNIQNIQVGKTGFKLQEGGAVTGESPYTPSQEVINYILSQASKQNPNWVRRLYDVDPMVITKEGKNMRRSQLTGNENYGTHELGFSDADDNWIIYPNIRQAGNKLYRFYNGSNAIKTAIKNKDVVVIPKSKANFKDINWFTTDNYKRYFPATKNLIIHKRGGNIEWAKQVAALSKKRFPNPIVSKYNTLPDDLLFSSDSALNDGTGGTWSNDPIEGDKFTLNENPKHALAEYIKKIKQVSPNTDLVASDGTLLYSKKYGVGMSQEEKLEYLKSGGSFNVIPEGALHKNKHHLEDVDDKFKDVTTKGIPVVIEENGEGIQQQAEVEKEEIIFNLDVTKKLESLKEKGTDEAAIEAGKLLVYEILDNTVDNANIIKNI